MSEKNNQAVLGEHSSLRAAMESTVIARMLKVPALQRIHYNHIRGLAYTIADDICALLNISADQQALPLEREAGNG